MTLSCPVELLAVGFVLIAKDHCRETLNDAIANVKAVLDVSKGKKKRLLLDVRKTDSQDREARNYYQGSLNAMTTLAVASVISSPLQRLIGNFFLGLKLKTPVRLFNDVLIAQRWLMSVGPSPEEMPGR